MLADWVKQHCEVMSRNWTPVTDIRFSAVLSHKVKFSKSIVGATADECPGHIVLPDTLRLKLRPRSSLAWDPDEQVSTRPPS